MTCDLGRELAGAPTQSLSVEARIAWCSRGRDHREEARIHILRSLAYRVAVSDRLERSVRRTPWLEERLYPPARRYVGGRTLEEALATVDELTARGFAVSLDFFGESVEDPLAVEAVVAEYLRAADALARLDAEADLEVVPSHLGIDTSVSFFCRQVTRIAEGLSLQARLQVSAEESHRTERIVDAAIALAGDDVPVQITLQANLRRTAADADRLAEAGIPIRLVKGAYLEGPSVAYRWGEETDLAFVGLAHRLIGDGARLALATHDPVILEAFLPVVSDLAIEMLLGVKTDYAAEILDRGHPVRIYVPYGDRWFRYWTRRRVEALTS